MFYLKSFLFRWNWQNHNEADDIIIFNQNKKGKLLIFNFNLLVFNKIVKVFAWELPMNISTIGL